MRLTSDDIQDVLDHCGDLNGRVIEAHGDGRQTLITSRRTAPGPMPARVELQVYYTDGRISYIRETSRWHERLVELLVARGAQDPWGGAA